MAFICTCMWTNGPQNPVDKSARCPSCTYWDDIATGCHSCETFCEVEQFRSDCDALCPDYMEQCTGGQHTRPKTTRSSRSDGSSRTDSSKDAVNSYIYIAFVCMAVFGGVILILAVILAIRWRRYLGCRRQQRQQSAEEDREGQPEDLVRNACLPTGYDVLPQTRVTGSDQDVVSPSNQSLTRVPLQDFSLLSEKETLYTHNRNDHKLLPDINSQRYAALTHGTDTPGNDLQPDQNHTPQLARQFGPTAHPARHAHTKEAPRNVSPPAEAEKRLPFKGHQEVTHPSDIPSVRRTWVPASPEISASFMSGRSGSAFSSSKAPSVDLRTNPRSSTILDRLQASIDRSHTTRLNVCRSDALQAALRAMNKPNFDPKHRLEVRFVDEEPVPRHGNHGIEGEAVVFRFFRLVLQQLSRESIFSGPLDKKTIVHNTQAIERDLYKQGGCLLAMSLVHGGPAPHFFSQSAYDVITVGPDSCEDDLTRECWEQFLCGLFELGVLNTIRSDVEAMRPYFIPPELVLKAYDVEAIFSNILYSPEGSSERRQEERMVSYFRDFLVDVEEGLSVISLKDILVFTISSATLPSLGLACDPTLDFASDEQGVFPRVDSEPLVLTLPLKEDYNVFMQQMEKVVQQYVEPRQQLV